jgi:signal transduction histidine kinase
MPTFRSIFGRLDASLRARILVPTAILFGLTLAAMVVGAVQSYGAGMERGRQDRSEIYAHMVATGVSNVMLSGQPQSVPQLLESLVSHRGDLLTASLIAPNGQVSISSDPSYVGTSPWGRPDRFVEVTVVTEPGGVANEYAVIQPIVSAASCSRCHEGTAKMRGWLELRFSREPIIEAKRELAGTLALSAGVALVALLAIALWLLGREAIGPLRRLVGAMRRAEAGELTVVADEGRTDELGVAARGFDATLAALRRSQAELEAFYVERMVRADRFAAVGEVATGLAHEIKNPLAGLSGALELLAEDLATHPRHAEVVLEMRHQVQRLTRTMESLLSFARPPKAELRSTDVNATLEKVLFLIRQQCRGTSVEVQAQLDGALPPVLADPSQLEQVFLNICLNAVQAMNGRTGSIRVGSRRGEAGLVIVEVTDAGPGIPPDLREQLFKPFFTTKREGNGLGLAISARIVGEHGGHIGYRCPADGGTIFTITLKEAQAPRGADLLP